MSIASLVQKYHKGIAEYRNQKYNETQLRNDFLDPFFELLGWDIRNTSGKPTNEREVLVEEGLKDEKSANTKKPDYTFRLFSARKFFAEAKKPSVKIESDSEAAKQVRRYGFTANLKISVLTNFEHLIIYDCATKVLKEDSFQTAIVKVFHYSEYSERFDEINSLIGRESVYCGNFDAEWEFVEGKANRITVDDLFLSQINEWRILLGQEIFNHRPNIKWQNLNDQVQSYLNRIVFLRVCEDRNLEEYKTLLDFANTEDFNALIIKFREADIKYNSGLFDQLLSDEIIGNVSSVFWRVIHQLYYPESPYSFSVLSSDILGKIYEIFLTEQLQIIEGKVTLVKKPDNIDKDIVTTPTYIIQDIIRETIAPYCLDKSDDEVLSIRVADIACGSGSFLLEAYQYLNDRLIDYYLEKNREALIQTGVETYKLPFTLKVRLLLNCIHGVDKDYNAVEAAKFGLLLKLLENEDTNTTALGKPILPDLNKNIHFGNSLISPRELTEMKISQELYEHINPFDFTDSSFNIIIGNPPYMKSEDMKNITPEEYAIYNKIYGSAYKQYDKYFLFVERTLSILVEGGVYGYILPIKFAKVGAGQKLRESLFNSRTLRLIVSFGANQVFSSKTTYTCLLIGEKNPSDTFRYFEVKNLSAWKIRDYQDSDFEEININSLQNDVWVLVPKYLRPAAEKILEQSVPLEELLGDDDNISNGIQTSANEVFIFQPNKEDGDYFYFEKDAEVFKVEKELTRPYFQTSRGDDNLYTYRPLIPNSRVIYPYKITNGDIEHVSIQELEGQYPYLYSYLLRKKERLQRRDIKPEPETMDEWYRYGRHQALEKCEVDAKIVVGVLSVGNKYAIDFNQTLISSGGTAGYCMIVIPENSPYSIYYIQAILNSKYVEWYSSLLGEVFRGGYIAKGTKTLKRLPIRAIDFSNQEEVMKHFLIAQRQEIMISVYAKMEECKAAGDKRELLKKQDHFNRLMVVQNRELAALYDLGDVDFLIPSIQELYAAN
jgi:type I restriction-modification system DNA methylase subunit